MILVSSLISLIVAAFPLIYLIVTQEYPASLGLPKDSDSIPCGSPQRASHPYIYYTNANNVDHQHSHSICVASCPTSTEASATPHAQPLKCITNTIVKSCQMDNMHNLLYPTTLQLSKICMPTRIEDFKALETTLIISIPEQLYYDIFHTNTFQIQIGIILLSALLLIKTCFTCEYIEDTCLAGSTNHFICSQTKSILSLITSISYFAIFFILIKRIAGELIITTPQPTPQTPPSILENSYNHLPNTRFIYPFILALLCLQIAIKIFKLQHSFSYQKQFKYQVQEVYKSIQSSCCAQFYTILSIITLSALTCALFFIQIYLTEGLLQQPNPTVSPAASHPPFFFDLRTRNQFNLISLLLIIYLYAYQLQVIQFESIKETLTSLQNQNYYPMNYQVSLNLGKEFLFSAHKFLPFLDLLGFFSPIDRFVNTYSLVVLKYPNLHFMKDLYNYPISLETFHQTYADLTQVSLSKYSFPLITAATFFYLNYKDYTEIRFEPILVLISILTMLIAEIFSTAINSSFFTSGILIKQTEINNNQQRDLRIQQQQIANKVQAAANQQQQQQQQQQPEQIVHRIIIHDNSNSANIYNNNNNNSHNNMINLDDLIPNFYQVQMNGNNQSQEIQSAQEYLQQSQGLQIQSNQQLHEDGINYYDYENLYQTLKDHYVLKEGELGHQIKEWPSDEFGNIRFVHGSLIIYNAALNHWENQWQQYNMPIGWLGFQVGIDDGIDYSNWIMLYHGTPGMNIKSIISTKQLIPGFFNYFGGKHCRITNSYLDQGTFKNTYLTDRIEVAESYTQKGHEIGNKKYKFIFQCLVDPAYVQSPSEDHSIYVVRGNDVINRIHIYRLLVKETDE